MQDGNWMSMTVEIKREDTAGGKKKNLEIIGTIVFKAGDNMLLTQEQEQIEKRLEK